MPIRSKMIESNTSQRFALDGFSRVKTRIDAIARYHMLLVKLPNTSVTFGIKSSSTVRISFLKSPSFSKSVLSDQRTKIGRIIIDTETRLNIRGPIDIGNLTAIRATSLGYVCKKSEYE